jgi:DsbC/DsbD-like thiol-disulfide interchange protein
MRLTIAAAAVGLALAPAAPAFAAADPAKYMPAELIAETYSPRPGSTILVGFRLTPNPGWHGYWSNPGDSGIAPSVTWTAPKGVSFGPLLHPAPTLISGDGISSYVHEGPHVLLSRVAIDRAVEPGAAIPIKARFHWAACTATQCVPLQATFSLDLVACDGAPGSDSGAVHAAKGKLPAQAPNGTFSISRDKVELRLPASVKLDPRHARFFPAVNDRFVTAAALVSKDGASLRMNAPFRAGPDAQLAGVVTDGQRAYAMVFERGAAPVELRSEAAPPPTKQREDETFTDSVSPTVKEPPEKPSNANESRWPALAILLVGAFASALALRWRRR